MRSFVYPDSLSTVFRALGWLGCDDPLWTMRAVRGVGAVVSLLPVWLFWLVVARWRRLPDARLPLLLFAGSGLLVLQVQPSGPAIAAALAVSAALAVHGPGWFPALGGLCLGLAFCGRFQDALFGPGLLAVLLWQRRWSAAVLFACACLPGVALQGLSDVAHGAGFLSSPLAYFHQNVVEGAASSFRQQPWWFYGVAVAVALGLLPPCVPVAWRRFVTGCGVLPGAAAAAIVHLLAHSCIGRKAVRFEFPALAMLLAVIAVGLPAVRTRWSRWHTAVLTVVHGSIFLWASLWFGNAGAVRSALWLREQTDFIGEVVVAGGPVTALGGFYYLRPATCAIRAIEQRAEFGQQAQESLRAGTYVVVPRESLPAADSAESPLRLVATFTGQFDLRRNERRYVYRRR
jgi:hypothetical protein